MMREHILERNKMGSEKLMANCCLLLCFTNGFYLLGVCICLHQMSAQAKHEIYIVHSSQTQGFLCFFFFCFYVFVLLCGGRGGGGGVGGCVLGL